MKKNEIKKKQSRLLLACNETNREGVSDHGVTGGLLATTVRMKVKKHEAKTVTRAPKRGSVPFLPPMMHMRMKKVSSGQGVLCMHTHIDLKRLDAVVGRDMGKKAGWGPLFHGILFAPPFLRRTANAAPSLGGRFRFHASFGE